MTWEYRGQVYNDSDLEEGLTWELVEAIHCGTLIDDVVNWTYTVLDSVSSNPIQDVTVKITTDILGANMIATSTTNQQGIASFQLNRGTVYIWCFKYGYSFSNPQSEVIA